MSENKPKYKIGDIVFFKGCEPGRECKKCDGDCFPYDDINPNDKGYYRGKITSNDWVGHWHYDVIVDETDDYVICDECMFDRVNKDRIDRMTSVV